MNKPIAVIYDDPYDYIQALENYVGMLEHDLELTKYHIHALKEQIKEYLLVEFLRKW